MAARRIFYAGTMEEVAHHAAPFADLLNVGIRTCAEIREEARPGDVCLFYNEFFDRFRDLCRDLNQRSCRTVYAIDGILEWRNLWENPPAHPLGGEPHPGTMRPALSQVVACIGASQTRQLELWGNAGKCITIGLPRLDRRSPDGPTECSRTESRSPEVRRPGSDHAHPVLLIATAKNPGFTAAQRDTTLASLAAVRDVLAARFPQVRVMWRITAGLDQQLRVPQDGRSLAEQLAVSDAVVTTPSTLLLESMLEQRPTSLLDFHNRPQYVRAAWNICCRDGIPEVLSSLLAPSAERMQHQAELLQDALCCEGSATSRMVTLLTALRDAHPEESSAAIVARVRTEIRDAASDDIHPPFRQVPGFPDLSTADDRDREILELRQRLRVRDSQLEAFEKHPVLGLLLKMRRSLRRRLGVSGS